MQDKPDAHKDSFRMSRTQSQITVHLKRQKNVTDEPKKSIQ